MSGESAASEWMLTGTHDGDFPDLPATGRSLEIRGVSALRVRDGEIASQRDDYDRASSLVWSGWGRPVGERAGGGGAERPAP